LRGEWARDSTGWRAGGFFCLWFYLGKAILFEKIGSPVLDLSFGVLLGPSWTPFGTLLDPLGSLLGLSWGPLGIELTSFLSLLGVFWDPLVPSLDAFRLSWDPFGPSWDSLRTLLDPLGSLRRPCMLPEAPGITQIQFFHYF